MLHIFQYVPKYRYKVPVEWMVEIIRTDVRKKLAEAKRVLNDAGVEVEVMMLEDGFPSQQILTFMPDCPGERSRRNGPQLRRHDCAVRGYLPPIMGAVAQEVIDLVAVLNALRASIPGKNSRISKIKLSQHCFARAGNVAPL
ncbi:MAG TPA: hypothetical protein VGN34_28460 [Ktedonobacteraceae bacterium]